MFTATKDKALLTTTTGALPRRTLRASRPAARKRPR